jgi:gamma-tubulin complex component 5
MEEPFSGDHWGAGYDEEVHEGWTDSSGSDDGSQSSEEEDERIVTPLTERTRNRKEIARRELEEQVRAAEERLRLAEDSLRTLQDRYWKTGGKELEQIQGGLFGWRSIMTGESRISCILDMPDLRRKCRQLSRADRGRQGQRDHGS